MILSQRANSGGSSTNTSNPERKAPRPINRPISFTAEMLEMKYSPMPATVRMKLLMRMDPPAALMAEVAAYLGGTKARRNSRYRSDIKIA